MYITVLNSSQNHLLNSRLSKLIMKSVPSVWARQEFSTRGSCNRVFFSSIPKCTLLSDTFLRKKRSWDSRTTSQRGKGFPVQRSSLSWRGTPTHMVRTYVWYNTRNTDRSPSTFDIRYNRDIRSYVRHGDWLPSDAKRLGPGGPSGSQGGSRMRLAAGKATEEGGNAILAGSVLYVRSSCCIGTDSKEREERIAATRWNNVRSRSFDADHDVQIPARTVGNARTRDIPTPAVTCGQTLSNSSRSSADWAADDFRSSDWR